MLFFILLTIFIVIVIARHSLESHEKRKKYEKREKMQRHKSFRNHRDNDKMNFTCFDYPISPTGDYQEIFGGDYDGSYLWCTSHLSGKRCPYCIHRKSVIKDGQYIYGPSSHDECASRCWYND